MTIEEAIHILTKKRDKIKDLLGSALTREKDYPIICSGVKALDVALSALRAQQEAEEADRLRNPCADCGAGWGCASANGESHTCHETCEKFKAWKNTVDEEKNDPLTLEDLKQMFSSRIYPISI